ncbi:MAG: glycosyltransferase family 39 protein [Bacteroidales bacterium]|nr:glycosyltransferase family 39 protein [Bacteroidales bacterium]
MKKRVVIIFILLAGILFIGNNSISLWDQDEAAYAGFGKTMIETGDYTIPQFTWSEVHRKTPLHFWLISVAYKIFGINEFAVRFFSSLAIFLVYVLIYVYGKRWLKEQEAFFASIILGTSIFVPMLGKMAITDGLLLLFHTLAAFSLIEVLRTKSFKQVLIFWFAISMGLLVKGPPILIFAGFMIILLFIFHKNRMNLIRLHPWIFGFIAILPLYLWGREAWQKDGGEFIKWLIDWYILTRVDKSVFSQTGPPGYFLASFVIFFVAYLAFLPAAFINAFKSFKNKESNTFILLIWLISGWLFYEFLKSKLPAYAVAAYPAIAMLISQQILKFGSEIDSPKLVKISAAFQTFFAMVIFGASILAVIEFLPKEWSFLPKFFTVFVPFLFFAGSVLGLILVITNRRKKFIDITIANAFVFTALSFIVLLPAIDNIKNSTKRVAEYVATNSDIDKIVISNKYAKPPSLPFYLEVMNPNADIEEDYNIQSLMEKYESDTSYAFILTKEQLEEIRKKDPRMDIKEISSFSTGKSGKNNYFITFNKCRNCE